MLLNNATSGSEAMGPTRNADRDQGPRAKGSRTDGRPRSEGLSDRWGLVEQFATGLNP